MFAFEIWQGGTSEQLIIHELQVIVGLSLWRYVRLTDQLIHPLTLQTAAC